MALEEIKARISLLLAELNNQPEDVAELHERLREKLNELRSLGQPLPQDLTELEQRIANDTPLPSE